MYYIGIMSGTSLDGVDALLVDFKSNSNRLEVVESVEMPFPKDLKNELKELISNFTIHLKELGRIETHLGVLYSDAVKLLLSKSGVSANQIIAIGCHGQTVYHEPRSEYPFSMQIGNGNVIAANTGILTVMDFRGMDIAYGGDGAPLAPGFHQSCFNVPDENRVLLNLGGIANITVLNIDPDKVIGFDTGPANCLMDLWIQSKLDKKYDKNGKWASSGKINNDLLELLLNENYFKVTPPKSTGKELFNLAWLDRKLTQFGKEVSDIDIQTTLCELTAVSVADAIKNYAHDTDALYSCGGGSFNEYLQGRLSFHLPGVKVGTTADIGFHPQHVEAAAFAWLAKQRVENRPGNIPSVTGASKYAISGCIYTP